MTIEQFEKLKECTGVHNNLEQLFTCESCLMLFLEDYSEDNN